MQLDVQTINQRAIKGFFSLTIRRVALQLVSFITINLILARILPVSTLGIFNIGIAIIAFFSFFADIGLAAAIIQKKEKVSAEDLKTTFTMQFFLVLILVLLIWFLAPNMAHLYGLDEGGMWLIRALAVSFLITSFKVIPAVLLERELKFTPLVAVEVLETLVFNVVLLSLVFLGLGILAFAHASLLRAIFGAVTIFLIAPWKVSFGISRKAAAALLGFGIPYQTNAILALLKDRLVPLLIARMIGPSGMGFVTWAQNLAFLPLEVINIIIRVNFPTLSRLQQDPKNLKKALEKSLFLTTLFLYPLLFGMLALAPSLVEHVVSSKWAPALPSFYLFSLSTFWATLSTTFTNTLNAIGQIKTTLKLMVFWTTLTWLLTPALTFYFGFLGVALSSALISLTSVVTIIIIKRFIALAIWENIWQPLFSSALMAFLTFLLAQKLVFDFWSLILLSLWAALIYWLVVWILASEKLKSNFGEVKNAFFNR